MKSPQQILFLGETYRADAQTWIRGIEQASGLAIDTDEIAASSGRLMRILHAFTFFLRLLWGRFFGKKYDLVLAERSTSYGFFSLFTNARIKVVAQQGISDIYPPTPLSIFYKSRLQSMVYRRADLIHAWGHAMVPAMLKSGASPDKILVLPKGLDLSLYRFQEHDYQQTKIWKAIVTRTMEADYCHDDIIKAIALLKNKGIQLHTTMVGRGSLTDSLKALSKNLKVDELIHFTGPIPNDELPPLLRESQIYLSAPVTEGVSSSLFEAMASGCFPIVTDLPGNRAFINPHRNGKLFPVHDVEAMAAAIMEFIQSPEQFREGINKNRNLIESDCDRKRNMETFWKSYTIKFN